MATAYAITDPAVKTRERIRDLSDRLYAERAKNHSAMAVAALRAGGIAATDHSLKSARRTLAAMDRVFANNDASKLVHGERRS